MAEDGRCVKNLNISPFIKWLPTGDPENFSTVHASGSTSQAANIMEAVDSGAKLLLIDEDRSATNFMIRDRLMKALIQREPITPFTDRVRELAARDVSTILVIGGSGEYLAAADAVYLMDAYEMIDVTEEARDLSQEYGIVHEQPESADWTANRLVLKEHFSSYPQNSGSERMEVSEMGYLIIGDEMIDLRGLQQLMTDGQRQAVGFLLRYLMIREKEEVFSLSERLEKLMLQLEKEGLDAIYSSYFTSCGRFFDLPRMQDIIAVVYRMRQLTYRR
jgi:predicted ABC-class ATPase